MKIELGIAVAQLDQRIKSEHFVRAVLSGRRRNMQTEFERIDIKPVLIKEEIKWQIISSDAKKDITKNVEVDFNFTQLFSSGYANLVVDIAIALHACDTATDDAIYWAVKNNAQVIMAAPCCMHELQTQIKEAPEPWALLTKNGLVKERLVDLMTDSLRAQILKLLGYRVDIVEFIGGEHTARNILIRAVKTNQSSSDIDKDRYQQMLSQWQIKPYLAKLLAVELKASAGI